MIKSSQIERDDKYKSETVTEDIFRQFYGLGTFIEKSAIPPHYGFKSKNKTQYKGYPDFFRDNPDEDFVVVVEAKADDYKAACDEVKFYALNNQINKDIIAISIAGQNLSTYRSGLFFLIDGNFKEIPTDGKLLTLKDIWNQYRKEKYGECTSTDSLKTTLMQLNSEFHGYNIKDTERSLFFAGLMIALKDNTFAKTYRAIQDPTSDEQKKSTYKLIGAHNLNSAILDAIVRQISNKINNLSKEYNWKDRFSFIKNIDIPLHKYKEIISKIEDKIFKPFKMDEKQDILGRAYKIFLSKAGKIDNKNIILTPDHIKSLMVDLARLNVTDVVLDTCTGSGGFLMEAMETLIDLAKNNSNTIRRIKEQQLIGFEIDPTLFALACSNMFLHGDGRTNLIFESCITEEGSDLFNAIRTYKANKCIINPPYENNNPIIFTKQALDYIESGGKLIIIMPTPTLNRNIGGMTDEILRIARLDFVIKMPTKLFSEQKRTVNTSIFGFTKVPHEKSDRVIFYNMDDDGLVSVQHKGRIDKYGNWAQIKNKVIRCIKYNEDVDADYSKMPIYDGDILNCYGIKKHKSGENGNWMKLGKLFNAEKGTLQSENSADGEFDFITASEEWKTNEYYDHDCEAIVYAVQAGGSLGRSHYVNGKFIASNLCLILTPKKEKEYPLNVQFYSLYLNAIRKQIVRELADGTSKLTILKDDLLNYYVEYFPIQIQNKIVNFYIDNILFIQQELNEAKRIFEEKIGGLL